MAMPILVVTVICGWLFSLQLNRLYQYWCANSSFKLSVEQIRI